MAHSNETQIMRYKWLNFDLVWFQNYEQVSWLAVNVFFPPKRNRLLYLFNATQNWVPQIIYLCTGFKLSRAFSKKKR